MSVVDFARDQTCDSLTVQKNLTVGGTTSISQGLVVTKQMDVYALTTPMVVLDPQYHILTQTAANAEFVEFLAQIGFRNFTTTPKFWQTIPNINTAFNATFLKTTYRWKARQPVHKINVLITGASRDDEFSAPLNGTLQCAAYNSETQTILPGTATLFTINSEIHFTGVMSYTLTTPIPVGSFFSIAISANTTGDVDFYRLIAQSVFIPDL